MPAVTVSAILLRNVKYRDNTCMLPKVQGDRKALVAPAGAKSL